MHISNQEIMEYTANQSSLFIGKDRTDPELYDKYNVKRGLRDRRGNGVVSGLTHISEINAFRMIDGVRTPIEGELFYRGIDVKKLISGFMDDKRLGFEETAYLLLFGSLPTAQELSTFTEILAECRVLPKNFTRDIIFKAPPEDIMNSMTRSVLSLSYYDKATSNLSLPNVLLQSMKLIATFPMLAVYAYNAYAHYGKGESLIIHNPDKNLSTAENLLRLMRPDKKYTPLEAQVLDAALILHMEHGGGNNSTFTSRVITSAGSDTYSVIAAALCSLKGPKHGGANIRVVQMMNDIKKHVKDTDDEEEVENYLIKILNKEAFDRSGLIYGMGHAIYSLSDPRAEVFRSFVASLASEKGRDKDWRLYTTVEHTAKRLIEQRKNIFKGVSANVDFYSGFVYSMLGIPEELFTPIFAIARIVGWSAHRMEELVSGNKIMRPAYIAVGEHQEYVPLSERE